MSANTLEKRPGLIQVPEDDPVDDAEFIVELWGEGFRELATHPRLKFYDDCIVQELWRDIEAHGQSVREIAIREPRVKNLKQLDRANGDVEKAAVLYRECANLPNHSIDCMFSRDFVLGARVAAGFLHDGQATGKT